MAKLYGHGATLDQTFQFNGNAPIDDRLAVQTVEDLASINPYKGLLVFVEDENTYYSYNLNTEGQYQWQKAALGEGAVSSVFFETLRALQAEVTKLRNSFIYGISSYQGIDTASSTVVNGYQHVDDMEPLWAISEDDLSYATELEVTFDTTTSIRPNNNTTLDLTTPGVIGIADASWIDDGEYFKQDTSAKQFIYMTSTSNLLSLELLNEEGNKLTVDFSALNSFTVQQYHYTVILSRKVNNKGYRYLYISIDNNVTGANIQHGYYNGTLQTQMHQLSSDYYIHAIHFKDCKVTKLNFYTKYQNFDNELIPSAPKEQDYKYEAAHITVREVKDSNTLESIKAHLLTPELVWIADEHILKINTAAGIFTIGSSQSNDDIITMEQIKQALYDLGIVQNNQEQLELNNIAKLTMINQEGIQSTLQIDSEGSINVVTDPKETLQDQLNDINYNSTTTQLPILNNGTIAYTDWYTRGFAARLAYVRNNATTAINKDWALNSDRIKIEAFYMALGNEFGCTHSYIELGSTNLNADFPLNGCKIAFTYPTQDATGSIQQVTIVKKLQGTIPAGGTYLIRGKKHCNNAIINVDTYDIEWLEFDTSKVTTSITGDIGFMLYYDPDDNVDLNEATMTLISATEKQQTFGDTPYKYKWYYIDSVGIQSTMDGNNPIIKWYPKSLFTVKANAIYKNITELDPAKQAFQALSSSDSSRIRNDKAQDFQTIELSTNTISFPHSFIEYDISKFTPKASYQHKNVCTDKTQPNRNKPNMVTCSFGIDMLTTRCFNWFSIGTHNEYVFIKTNTGWARFESYGGKDNDNPIDWTKKALNYPEIYNRIYGTFPAQGDNYTAHKCIISTTKTFDQPTVFTYVVGRAATDGTPDFEHCSEEYTFTMYPSTYIPRIYQITDQQGFHWIEYQVWAAAALELDKKIKADCAANNIIPVLINTGDATQNGSRINEWLDYYNAGLPLFKHLEQMNVVGNNDLCNVDHNNLGTGDDPGKSNPYYFKLLYCYEQPNPEQMIVNGIYIPSNYYFGTDNYKFLMVNSEITHTACEKLYKVTATNASGETRPVNIYTGWTVKKNETVTDEWYPTIEGFTPIYTTIYTWLNTNKASTWTAACHEMPFTVITQANLALGTALDSRSKSGTSLVGSHLNQILYTDNKAVNWFSRLLEYFKVPICIGGHKHSYMCSFPLRENFTWDTHSSKDTQYTMPATLETDNVQWINGGKNTTKLPYAKNAIIAESTDSITPGISYTGNLHAVTYFMCQATGYKLKSNKELPSFTQAFSKVVAGNGKSSDKPNASEKAQVSQLYPMFGIIYPETGKIQLGRFKNILKITSSNAEKFDQYSHSTEPIRTEYLDGSAINQVTVLDNSKESHGILADNYIWNTNNNYIV